VRMAHGSTMAKAHEPSVKPVSRRHDPVETLAFLIERDAKRAREIHFLFEKLADLAARPENHELVTEFVWWWRERALLTPTEGEEPRRLVSLPWETEIHHRILDAVLLARRVMEARPSAFPLPDAYPLPCETCGRIFETRAPRFGRICGDCHRTRKYDQSIRDHRLGSRAMWTGGFYEKGPERRRYVWPTVCEHPECVDVFSAPHPEAAYCPKHRRTGRVAAHRASLSRAPKRTRYRFYPNYEVCDEGTSFSYFFTIAGENRECVIGPDGYQARDEEELRELAHCAASDEPLLILKS
jgi:hypothetical protein